MGSTIGRFDRRSIMSCASSDGGWRLQVRLAETSRANRTNGIILLGRVITTLSVRDWSGLIVTDLMVASTSGGRLAGVNNEKAFMPEGVDKSTDCLKGTGAAWLFRRLIHSEIRDFYLLTKVGTV